MKETVYVKVPRPMLNDISISARAKICMVMLIALYRSKDVFYDDLATTTGFSMSTVYRSVTELLDHNYCEVDSQKRIKIIDWRFEEYV